MRPHSQPSLLTRRQRRIAKTAIALAAATFAILPATAAVIDYSLDDALTEVPVTLPTGETTLADALKSIEAQTEYRFTYLAASIPADKTLVSNGDTLSLADTLFNLSEETGVVFDRVNGKIAIRARTDTDEIRRPSTLPEDPGTEGGTATMVEGLSIQGQKFQTQRDQLSMERKVSAGMMTFLSTEDMSKFGGSDLSDVVNRMVGVNVVEGRFAVVRGLSDRYSSTLVNGLPMPSPDPLRQGVQLDLFPTSIIDNIVTHKNALPNMPMNSSGAAFELHTKAFTDDFNGWFKTGYSINSNAQSKFLRNPNNGAYRFFPYNNDTFGSMPPPNAPVDGSTLDRLVGVREGSAPITPNFELGISDGVEYWGKRKVRFVVAASYDSSAKTSEGWEQDRLAGNGVYRGPGNRLNRTGSLYNKELPGYGLHYDLTRSESNVLFSGLGGLQFDLDEEGRNKITFTTLYSQSANNRAQHKANGQISEEQAAATRKLVSESGGQGIRVYTPPGYTQSPEGSRPLFKLEGKDIVGWGNGDSLLLNNMAAIYEERNLTAYQLGGEHDLTDWSNLKLSWGVTYASTTVDSNSSDLNFVEALPGKYADPSIKRYGYSSGTDMEGSVPYAIKRTWNNINENIYGGRLDLEYGFDFWNNLEAKVKGGVYWQKTERDTKQTDVDIYINHMITGDTLEEFIGKVMQQGGGQGGVPLSSAGSTAKVTREHQAAYVMLNLPLLSNVTLTGGARFEHLEMSAQGNVRLIGAGRSMNAILNNKANGGMSLGEIIGYTKPTELAKFSKDYILPSAVLTWNITDALIFRAGGSHTVALPSMREMSPYFSWDNDFNEILGNPNLKPVDVYAGEARIEYYTDSGGMFSAGAFYKQLKNPIERFAWSSSNSGEISTFWNSPETAQIIGYEIEARHHLGFLAEELKYVSIGVNWSQMEAWIPVSDLIRRSYGYPFPAGSSTVVGPGVGPDGSVNVPKSNRLYDQPEWTANADISWVHPDWGTGITLMVYAQSDVLNKVGNGYTLRVDEYTLPYYELNLAITQKIWDNWTVKFSVSNLTDTERGLKYSDNWVNDAPTKRSYKVGQSYGISVEYKF